MEIVEHLSKHTEKPTGKDSRYYVVCEGFTIKEFISYINKLRKRKEA